MENVELFTSTVSHIFVMPMQEFQPTIWAIKALLLYYARHPTQQLEYYLDLHAHANKKVHLNGRPNAKRKEGMDSISFVVRAVKVLPLFPNLPPQGVFIFGNSLCGERHLSSLLYSRLVGLNSPIFDFVGCNYTEKNMSRPAKVSAVLICPSQPTKQGNNVLGNNVDYKCSPLLRMDLLRHMI